MHSEVYAEDGTALQDKPYSVTKTSYTVRRIQPRGPGENDYAVYAIQDGEGLVLGYERDETDPRVSHTLTLDVDQFGSVLRAASVTYPRRPGVGVRPEEQSRLLVTATQSEVANRPNEQDWYRVGLPVESQTFELCSIAKAGALYTREELFDAVDDAAEIAYHEDPPVGPSKRLIDHSRVLYRKDDLSGPLALSQIGSLGLSYETYKLSLTPALIAQHYGIKITDADLRTDGGYVKGADMKALALFPVADDGGLWWTPSGRDVFNAVTAAAHFYLPTGGRDPFGNVSTVAYDAHDLLVVRAQDPLGNVMSSELDYRVLQPKRVTDPNDNVSGAAFDALGHVVGAATMAKAGQNLGDSLAAFVSDLTDAEVAADLNDPTGNPGALLKSASTRLIYDIHRYYRTKAATPDGGEAGEPAVVHTISRETHAADLGLGTK